MKLLVIAPHPDDEVLGCGGTIAKYSKRGDEVYLCIATKAYTPDWTATFIKNRKREIIKSNKILGIKKTYYLDYPAAKLDTFPQKTINDSLQKIFKEVRPEFVYIPFKGDLNKDHRLLFESSLVVLRPVKQLVQKVLSYETASETEWGQSIVPFLPNSYEDISTTFNQKIEAMNAYQSELKKSPHPRSLQVIKSLAVKRGSEIGVKYAEAFTLIKELHR